MRRLSLGQMLGPMARAVEDLCSGDALLAFDGDLNLVSWNQAAEELTGVPWAEAIGRPCWEMLRGVDEDGGLICHPGCSHARLAREGWPVPSRTLVIRGREGRRRCSVATVALRNPDGALFVHLLREIPESGAPERAEKAAAAGEDAVTAEPTEPGDASESEAS